MALTLWTLSLTVLTTCVFAGHNLLTDDYQRWVHSVYITFVRPSWALALSWVIFACIFGYGGPVDWFLSLPVFQIVSRLTYSMYIVHLTIIVIVLSNTKTPLYFNNFYLVRFYSLIFLDFKYNFFSNFYNVVLYSSYLIFGDFSF